MSLRKKDNTDVFRTFRRQNDDETTKIVNDEKTTQMSADMSEDENDDETTIGEVEKQKQRTLLNLIDRTPTTHESHSWNTGTDMTNVVDIRESI